MSLSFSYFPHNFSFFSSSLNHHAYTQMFFIFLAKIKCWTLSLLYIFPFAITLHSSWENGYFNNFSLALLFWWWSIFKHLNYVTALVFKISFCFLNSCGMLINVHKINRSFLLCPAWLMSALKKQAVWTGEIFVVTLLNMLFQY